MPRWLRPRPRPRRPQQWPRVLPSRTSLQLLLLPRPAAALQEHLEYDIFDFSYEMCLA
jgi:hypothetical protein